MEICSFGSPSIFGCGHRGFQRFLIQIHGFPSLEFSSVLVKASHSPSELHCSGLEHAQVHAPYISIYTDGSKSSEDVGCAAVFPDFNVFISLPVVASIFTAELCAIFLTLSRISFHDSNSFVIYSDS